MICWEMCHISVMGFVRGDNINRESGHRNSDDVVHSLVPPLNPFIIGEVLITFLRIV
jgi:hypothetical protein